MKKAKSFSKHLLLLQFFILATIFSQAQSDSIVLKDLQWDAAAPAGTIELTIPSQGSRLAGFIYTANGIQKHPTLLLLHGYPGNERNLDLAQAVRAHGWNVIYFDYRGSWGSEGEFSFENCVQDVQNVVSFCKKYSESLRIDTSNIALFGHSMGGFICLKALTEIPDIKKGFALSTWNIYADVKSIKQSEVEAAAKQFPLPFVLNTTSLKLIKETVDNLPYYNLENVAVLLSGKQIIMLDEHHLNQTLAETIKMANRNYFEYEVWPTDHGFSNKRISLINKVKKIIGK